jgi:regulator of sigma E protease
MGPKVFSTTKGETKYSIRLLPLGGYVSMEGEDVESKDPRSFGAKSILQRASILFAGPFFNIIFAVVLLVPVFLYTGTPSTTLGQILPNSPAQAVGMQAGDKIININGNKIKSWEDVTTNLHGSDGKEVNIKVERNEEIKEFNLKPQKNEKGQYVVGIATKFEKSFLKSTTSAVTAITSATKQTLTFFGQLVTGTVPGGAGNAVAGPVGVVGMVSDAAKTGIPNLMGIASMISLSLGIFNLLPIPALDGGRLFMLAVEGIRGGKKLDPNKEATINMIGFVLLMGFMVFITYKDIAKLF